MGQKKISEHTIRAVRKRLLEIHHTLRKRYQAAAAQKKRSGMEQWICDNYYILERESKQMFRELHSFSEKLDAAALNRMYRACVEQFSKRLFSANQQELETLVEKLNLQRPLTINQFDKLPLAFRLSLMESAKLALEDRQEEHAEQLMASCVQGLGEVASIDFDAITQKFCQVDAILSQDPADTYRKMTEETRKYYRILIQKKAREEGENEIETAKRIIALAQHATSLRERHVGFYLLEDAKKQEQLENRGFIALGAVVGLTLACAMIFAAATQSILVFMLTLFPLFEIFRPIITGFALKGVPVRFIPRMDLEHFPQNYGKTAVVISTLLPSAQNVPALRERLERLYLANSQDDLYFCVLADLKESDYPSDAKDQPQIKVAAEMVCRLNTQYPGRFMLLVRPRVFSKTQNKFSGWERKRGAISQFAAMTQGGSISLLHFEGDRSLLRKTRYMIALDSDTDLLFNSAKKMISAAVHPLNQPVINPETGRVTAGYGILTPRMGTELESAKKTAFSRVMSGCGGTTSYDVFTQDVYQDLFGDSIFCGKGLIDLQVFTRVLGGSRLPEQWVLSHDILEGAYLRTGFLSDVEMTDGTPSHMNSWLSRLHRWIRGDWQNLFFLFRSYWFYDKEYECTISGLSRYKLFDNLRRPVTQIAAAIGMLAAFFMGEDAACILYAMAFLSVGIMPVLSAFQMLLTGGLPVLSRKFFTNTMPQVFEELSRAVLSYLMILPTAVMSADAIVRTLYRCLISKKNLLQWTTAAQGDRGGVTFVQALQRYWFPQLAALFLLFFGKYPVVRFNGLVLSLFIPIVLITAKPTRRSGPKLTTENKEKLISYCAAMWRYYEDYANKEHHYLPPDNVQQSPVYAVAARTSPTNIGMMLLSTLAARDFNLITSKELYSRLNRTLSTVEQLEKWNGNLYNWYDTRTLEGLHPSFVSTVDSGNFVCCLVTLKQGIKEYQNECTELFGLISRIQTLIAETDLSVFYQSNRNLFTIGYDAENNSLCASHYDFLMSEARMTSYFAVASRQVPMKHWSALNRTMSKEGAYIGPVSWTGTMFEYFMPHLLLPAYDGSLLNEALHYCIYCQQKRVRGLGVPWGISESGYFAFDPQLNYQYKAHGIQKIGVKRNLNKELVISPYSTFLVLPFIPNTAMNNLQHLTNFGMYGRYGFYEAIDFTDDRVQDQAVVRSYMAHHIGMSLIAACNSLLGQRMVKRFMRDPTMGCASQFLQEKINKETVVYDNIKMKDFTDEKPVSTEIDEKLDLPEPQRPRVAVLTNGQLSDFLTDLGAGFLTASGIDYTRRSSDVLRRAQGVFVLVKSGGTVLSPTKAPWYDAKANYSVRFRSRAVNYSAQKDHLEISMKCMLHETVPCEQRRIIIKNNSIKEKKVELFFYLEPTLEKDREYQAHPAFSKLFVESEWDKANQMAVFTRRMRGGSPSPCMVVSFLKDTAFELQTKKENLITCDSWPNNLLHFHKLPFHNGNGTPDAICAIRLQTTIPAGGKTEHTLLIGCANSKEEAIAAVVMSKRGGKLKTASAAASPILRDTIEGRLSISILGQLLFGAETGEENRTARQHNTLGQSGLWPMGISGDDPIVLMPIDSQDIGRERIAAYIRLQDMLNLLGIRYDLVLLFDSSKNEQIASKIKAMLTEIRISSPAGSLGQIYLVDEQSYPKEQITLLKAAARHISPRTMLIDAVAHSPYTPVVIHSVLPFQQAKLDGFAVGGGEFAEGRFYVDKNSPLPYSHILANPSFGTLVSDRAMGFTWAVNARENRLTPWYNDIATDNNGEMLLLRVGDRYFNLIQGSAASFSKQDASYVGLADGIKTTVRVTISETGCAKYTDVTLENTTGYPVELETAYYTEPVLGVTRETARFIHFQVEKGALVMTNPYNTAVLCSSVLASDHPGGKIILNRGAFFSGHWTEEVEKPYNDPCGVLIIPKKLPAKRSETIRFILTYGANQKSAVQMTQIAPRSAARQENQYCIHTPDEAFNQYMNNFASHQIAASRIWGRCAFYQCGGAYGFRDQLQDVAAYLLIHPKTARIQILRCCAVQFEQGDVLHWWHNLPQSGGGLRGVRTRYSDDLLWLPYTVARYVKVTGDDEILSVPVRYLTAPELEQDQQEHYLSPGFTTYRESVYDHCIRALRRACRLGENGLPLMGCGDWNDGMNRIGDEGRGTSVWLGMFLARVCEDFAQISTQKEDIVTATSLKQCAGKLKESLDREAWDGEWYRRAFFDDGTPVGSKDSLECRMDSLPQSFSAICQMPDSGRVEQALNNALKKLVDEKMQVIKLFDQPFDHMAKDPGYIKAYPKGIRENGGQYTHAGVWLSYAMFLQERSDDGYRLLKILNPVHRSMDTELSERYKLEPYYMAADIYTNPAAYGHGGWSIYTGAASWYYRVAVEQLLGLKRQGDKLYFHPNLPTEWSGFIMEAKIAGTHLEIEVSKTGKHTILCDGQLENYILLDGKKKKIKATV